MKKILTALLFCVSINAYSQTFSCNTVPAAIPDNNTLTSYPVNVAGISSSINSTYGLYSVTINVSHAQVSDLTIGLTSPNGTNCILSLHNGGMGANYLNTAFRMNATIPVGLGNPPFTGMYIPDNSINVFNNNQNPNGTWNLEILDDFPTVSGTLLSVNLYFANNPPPDPVITNVCALTNAAPCKCKDTTQTDCDLFPDLIVSAKVIRDGWNEATGSVSMSNAVINIGSGPVEMKPTGQCFCDTVPVACATTMCPNGMPPKERVRQRVYHKSTAGGAMTYTDYPAGNQSYHPAHGHVHAEEFCEFTLRVATSNPDPTTWPIIGSSLKQSYCMINMGTCDSQDSMCVSHGIEITNAMIPNLNLGVVTGCGSNGQGIFVGRYDLYGAGFGQTIQVPGICDGNYYIVTTIDPFNHFIEEDETNNTVAVPVTLTQQPGTQVSAAFIYGISGGMTVGFFNYTPNVTRTWDFGDGTPLTTASYPIHTYTTPGTYLVTLTVFDGTCASSSSQYVTVGLTGISETGTVNDLVISPNPASDAVTISFQLNAASTVELHMLNILGERVKVITEGNQLAGEHRFDLNDLAAGTYFVKLVNGDKQIIKKLIKL